MLRCLRLRFLSPRILFKTKFTIDWRNFQYETMLLAGVQQ